MKTITTKKTTALKWLCLVLLSSLTCAKVIAQNLNLSITTTNACYGADGTATITITGGTPPYSIGGGIWNQSSGYQSILNSSTTNTVFTYNNINPKSYISISVYDASNVSSYANEYIDAPFNYNLKFQEYYSWQQGGNYNQTTKVKHATCPLNNNGEIEIDSIYGGTGPYSVLWSNGNTNLLANNLTPGNYDFTLTDNSTGCFYTYNMIPDDSVSLVVISRAPFTAKTISTNANCINGTATISVDTGNATLPLTYNWNTIPIQTTATATGLHANNQYTGTITDANGCQASSYAYIYTNTYINSGFTQVNETCNQSNGSITAYANNGTAPYTYSWSTGQTGNSITGLGAGYYTCIVTDANGCNGYNNVYIEKTSPINISTINTVPSSCTANTGSATVSANSGTFPYTYLWDNGQTTTTATSLGKGFYTVKVTDATGCIKLGSVQINDNSTLAVSTSAIDEQCSHADGSVSATISGGVTPYTINWSNGATTANVNTIAAGYYTVSVKDANGCERIKSASVYNNTPVYLSFNATDASCVYTADGELKVIPNGGVAPYTYNWSNGQTTQTATGLLPGNYSVTVTDANGCTRSSYGSVGYATTVGCAVTISGNVFEDINNDCTQDYYENGIEGILISCSPNGGSQFTDAFGNYTFILPPGNYTIHQHAYQQSNTQYYFQNCPVGDVAVSLPTAGMSAPYVSFADTTKDIKDMRINVYNLTQPNHGFDFTQRVVYKNQGTRPLSGDFTVQHPNNINFINGTNSYYSSISNYDASTQTAQWLYSAVSPKQSDLVDITYHTPANVLVDTDLPFLARVNPFSTDWSPWDNEMQYTSKVVGSFDPNYVEVFPRGISSAGLINTTDDTTLTYVIHFQNEGNYPTTFIRVENQLDANVDIRTIKMLDATSSYKASITNTGKLIVDFPNYALVPKTQDPVASCGFVSYKIRQKVGLVPGNEIKSTADIYFDFNTPVITNTALNTIASPNGLAKISGSKSMVSLYPNPVKEMATIAINAETDALVQVRIVNMLGETIATENVQVVKGSNTHTISTSSLASGIYFMNITNGNTTVDTIKFVK